MLVSKIDRYLIRQVLLATLFSVGALSLVLILGRLYKEIHDLLVSKGMPISFIGIFVLQLLPFSLVFTIPWSFLAAVLLTFGRMSSDQEITAFRSSGLSLFRIAAPVLILGLGFSMLCLWLNASHAPRAKAAIKTMLYKQIADDPLRLIEPGVVQSKLRGQKMYIEERNASGGLHGFNAYQLSKTDENAPPLGYVYASNVQLSHNKDEQVFDFQLNHAYGEIYNKDGELQMFYAEKFEPWVLTYPLTRRSMKPNTLANDEIDELLKNPPPEIDPEKLPLYAFERDRRLAFSLAPLALAFVGIPLGMNSRRKETSSGLTMSLVIAFAYFLVLILAEETRSSNLALSQVLLWLPNVLGVTLGLWLMRRASRRG
ncbi:LptF/LptG family permease [Akkermansiaceae bacterium]|nr:LptF/LptG family permease [Akkermansiaceae bacterium]